MNLDLRSLINTPFDNSVLNIPEADIERHILNDIPTNQDNYYVTFPNGTIELSLDINRVIKTIFINPNKSGSFGLDDFHESNGRKDILNKMGSPNRHGDATQIPMLGFTGGFDRFDKEISYHFEYHDAKQTRLKRITLMSRETAP